MFNYVPMFWSTGARVTYLADDFKEIHLRLPLSWRPRNYVGIIFSGSMFSATDVLYFLLVRKNFGEDYIVWDKAATIQYKKPGRSTLQARVVISDAELAGIRRELAKSGKLERVYQLKLVDTRGEVCAIVDKTVSIRKK